MGLSLGQPNPELLNCCGHRGSQKATTATSSSEAAPREKGIFIPFPWGKLCCLNRAPQLIIGYFFQLWIEQSYVRLLEPPPVIRSSSGKPLSGPTSLCPSPPLPFPVQFLPHPTSSCSKQASWLPLVTLGSGAQCRRIHVVEVRHFHQR